MENQRGGARAGAGRKCLNKKKLSVRLSDEAYSKIEMLSRRYNITRTEVVERALNLTQNL